jgi:hypothetical protein
LTREEVERRLQEIMRSIYTAASSTTAEYGHPGNLVMVANIAGFVKVADAMMAPGSCRYQLLTQKHYAIHRTTLRDRSLRPV